MEQQRAKQPTSHAHERHRAHHNREWRRVVITLIGMIGMIGASSATVACSPSIRFPERTQVDATDYLAVPNSPRAPQVEIIPPSPSKRAVWIDGTWEFAGERYGWKPGAWVIPPLNARYARWVCVRREEDGQLFFAPSTWKDTNRKIVEDPPPVSPNARARSRVGGPAASDLEE